jgi:hypothetical protein
VTLDISVIGKREVEDKVKADKSISIITVLAILRNRKRPLFGVYFETDLVTLTNNFHSLKST